MSKHFEGVYQLFYYQPKPRETDEKLQIRFEKEWNVKDQQKLDVFFNKDVQVRIIEHIEEGEPKTTSASITDIFRLIMTKPRALANGDKNMFILENMCSRENLRALAELWKKNVLVTMDLIQHELQLEGTTAGEQDDPIISDDIDAAAEPELRMLKS